MKKNLLCSFIFIIFCSCSSSGIFGRSSKGYSGHSGMKSANAHAKLERAGNAYEDSITAAINAHQYTMISDINEK